MQLILRIKLLNLFKLELATFRANMLMLINQN